MAVRRTGTVRAGADERALGAEDLDRDQLTGELSGGGKAEVAQHAVARLGGVRQGVLVEHGVERLHGLAEELGQLPARTQVNVSTETTVYEIVGLDPEDI